MQGMPGIKDGGCVLPWGAGDSELGDRFGSTAGVRCRCGQASMFLIGVSRTQTRCRSDGGAVFARIVRRPAGPAGRRRRPTWRPRLRAALRARVPAEWIVRELGNAVGRNGRLWGPRAPFGGGAGIDQQDAITERIRHGQRCRPRSDRPPPRSCRRYRIARGGRAGAGSSVADDRRRGDRTMAPRGAVRHAAPPFWTSSVRPTEV